MVVAQLVQGQYVSSMVMHQMSRLHTLAISANDEHGSIQLEGWRGKWGGLCYPVIIFLLNFHNF